MFKKTTLKIKNLLKRLKRLKPKVMLTPDGILVIFPPQIETFHNVLLLIGWLILLVGIGIQVILLSR